MDPKIWWYIARASGLMAWWLLSLTVVWGLLLSSRILGPRRPVPARLLDLHRFLSGMSAAFVLVHLVALLADEFMDFGLPELLVPMVSPYRPGAVAWGVVAMYVMAAIVVTSLARRHLPHSVWRWVHYATFALFVLTTVHAFTAGTEATNPAVQLTGLAFGGAFLFLATYRFLTWREPSASSNAATRSTSESEGGEVGPTPPPLTRDTLRDRPVLVKELRHAADGVLAVRLAADDGGRLPAWEPGAHIDLVLPSGTVRQYSLCGDPADRDIYRVGVLKVPAGRGGSAEVHQLRAGQKIAVRGPRNRFPLVLTDRYLFIAGGIGITPLLPMIRRVDAAGLEWRLIYGGRSRTSMAFTEDLPALGGDRVRLVPEDTDGLPDLDAVLADARPGTAVYSCGPEPLIAALEKIMAADFPHLNLHIERFGPAKTTTAAPTSQAAAPEFEVELARSRQVLPVPADRSLLDVIRDAVPDAASSCGEGFCGTCKVTVLAGTPDHRDEVLAPSERGRTDVIYPCVSRARSSRLTLDL
ncbi:ferric reductase-like transmembrane domain-containing protein (plasmid) [Streptomyces sp. NBC_00637]|uniref:2Fe-2S iron-sulfur cluster-binding protein n=1 Tax=Streptomyces sp. NBC_00637 TaxID=2903667 RepID=UPI002F915DD7